ncbi:LD-carboxypeptidase [Ammoniphilus oxalaticus]|uniref:LD-carboxypeptidase n=1 Tax=Ammoniphilus oxalaticus TaxID=66863 RepID=A0A419SK93_9BACL|nr:LD-carboxypeptidase [Ammoniphilus oxalaticus]RKD24359.1 LD-carboxypeptidase [Ammoniphilus oxalaticus]
MAIRPPRLQRGDTIGIVTLGSPLAADTINARIQTLENMGFRIELGKYVYEWQGYLASSDRQRAEDLMDMFQNPEVKMILPTRGGVGVSSIFPYLDRTIISRNPKIVSGYSDISILLNMLYQNANLITFQSLLLIDFKPDTPPYNFDQFFAATSVVSPMRPIENPPDVPPLQSFNAGNVTGPIVGGNLTSLVTGLGTPYEINTRGKILLLEEVHEPINTVYRYFNQLAQAGKFRDCLGIVIGQCSQCPPAYGKSFQDLVDEFILPLNKPTITNLQTAHSYYKAAIPIGATVNLDTAQTALTVMQPTVR